MPRYRQATDGKQLKAARILLGMTVDEMAKAARINRNSVTNVEATEALPSSAYAADRIADYLRGHGIDFIEKEGKPGILFDGATQRVKSPYVRRAQA